MAMVDAPRERRHFKTIDNVKREQKRRLSSISYYNRTKEFNFGSLFQLIRVWEKKVKNKKATERTPRLTKEDGQNSQHSDKISDIKQAETDQKATTSRGNVFRVRFSLHCDRQKSNSLKKAQQAKISQLQVMSKTLYDRNEKLDKQMDIMRKLDTLVHSNERWVSIRESKFSKTMKMQKEVFQEEFNLTPW